MRKNLFGTIKPVEYGARIALVAPAGILPDKAHVDQAETNVRALGWIPVRGENIHALYGYLAGTDDVRLSDLNRAINDDSIDAIWCVRGGYGAMRLLPDIDYAALRNNPRPLIGFSDITALHAAIYRECGIVSFHGPTARGTLSDFSRVSLVSAVRDHEDSCGVASGGKVLRSGRARGRLAGGNLALITSLMGTPWSVDFDAAILIIEDTDEAVYRVDRMLTQLLLAGALQRCAGLVIGDFKAPANEKDTDNRKIDDIFAEAAEKAGIPCFAGAPFGHITDQWTIPLGAMGELDTADFSLHVTGG
ncbi:MAG: LD-carboxypeptidase [Gemmatimonadaceae bacterium]